jgi:MSHA biogenesis protein MshM
MYEQHFNLREIPFGLTPDTSYFYNYSAHQEAFNVLLVALRMGEGFIKIVGEVGTGKTLLCRKLLNSLNGEFVTAFIPNPYMEPTTFRYALAEELMIDSRGNIGQHRLLKLITAKLVELRREGKQVVLLMDEVQAMPEKTLEAVRLLTNLETEKSKLLQVVMFGQPELDQRLNQPQVRQLRQRITFSHRLQPMDRSGVEGYLRHRLDIAGYQGPDLFVPKAVKLLYKASGGIPRLVNILAHKAMMAAYGEGRDRVLIPHMRRAIADTENVHKRSLFSRFWTLGTSVSAVLVLAVLMSGIYLYAGTSI